MKHSISGMFFMLLIIISTSAHALSVDRVRFGVHPDKIRMVLEISDVTDFRAFALSSPYRIVVDLPEFQWDAGIVEKVKQSGISNIRQGKLSPGLSRIVFDLKKPAVIQSAFLLPKQGSKTNRIVIDYRLTTSHNFEKNKSTMHGTLKAQDYEIVSALQHKPAPRQNTQPPTQQDKPLIVIDPGHGGIDPGSVGHSNIYEKTVVLALAKELRKQLLKTGRYKVLLTREKDVFIRLRDRVKMARMYEGDLFLSIHADSIHKPKVHGVSIYTLSKKASDAQTAKLAEKENQADLMAGIDLRVEDEQVAFILGDFLMNDTMNQSKYFANTLVSKMKDHGVYTLENPHRYAGFAVLKAPDIPSILIEAGFMSNKKEANLLNKHSHRRKIAKSIVAGIDAYFDHDKKNNR